MIPVEEFDTEALKRALHISHGNSAAGNGVRPAAFHVSYGVDRYPRDLRDGELVDASKGASRFELVASD